MTLRDVLDEARLRLQSALHLDCRESALEARILLQHTLNVTHAWILTNESERLGEADRRCFFEQLQRRLTGEPIAYIIGQREFFGLTLAVSTDTLIPRPDTETLVEAALEHIPDNVACEVLDLGTGTGAIALAIASQRPSASLTAVDDSEPALRIAASNAERLGVRNVRFLRSDWFAGLENQAFDVIVSNPPYIASDDPHLAQGDLRFEPLSALVSGEDGLTDIRRIIGSSRKHLHKNGWLMFEHGYGQADAVASLLRQSGFQNVDHRSDLGGIVRVTLGCLPNPQPGTDLSD
jgi:release factor glutamine methyltransferase